MNKEDLKKVLVILNGDGIIDCNQYQGKDFNWLLDRINGDE